MRYTRQGQLYKRAPLFAELMLCLIKASPPPPPQGERDSTLKAAKKKASKLLDLYDGIN